MNRNFFLILLFIFPFMVSFVPNENRIVGRWAAPMFDEGGPVVYSHFYIDHRVEMDLNGNKLSGFWRWHPEKQSYEIIFTDTGIKLNLEKVTFKADTLFYNPHYEISSNRDSVLMRNYMVRIN